MGYLEYVIERIQRWGIGKSADLIAAEHKYDQAAGQQHEGYSQCNDLFYNIHNRKVLRILVY